MKHLQEYLSESLINEVNLEDMSEQDRILLWRSYQTEESFGLHCLTIDNENDTMKSFDIYENELKKRYGDSIVVDGDEHNCYLALTHAVLNIVAYQLIDGMSYQDAMKLEFEHIKAYKYDTKERKDMLMSTISRDKLGKDISRWKVEAPSNLIGFGSRKELERRLRKIKSDPKYQHTKLY